MNYGEYLKEKVRFLEILKEFVLDNDKLDTINYLNDLITQLELRIREYEKQELIKNSFDLEL